MNYNIYNDLKKQFGYSDYYPKTLLIFVYN